ncbi:unnamed protein product [Notodromas monacha]|uniref:Uncharacterized protein n=1 Tax=Notodromas monacha TaxID=399045 RepID=A0A7R9GGL4_9CRUS|nr:unnamed protein product [Notodromas monacha]CAG0920531.1 unnamed protein product [Notodromas monacha]
MKATRQMLCCLLLVTIVHLATAELSFISQNMTDTFEAEASPLPGYEEEEGSDDSNLLSSDASPFLDPIHFSKCLVIQKKTADEEDIVQNVYLVIVLNDNVNVYANATGRSLVHHEKNDALQGNNAVKEDAHQTRIASPLVAGVSAEDVNVLYSPFICNTKAEMTDEAPSSLQIASVQLDYFHDFDENDGFNSSFLANPDWQLDH